MLSYKNSKSLLSFILLPSQLACKKGLQLSKFRIAVLFYLASKKGFINIFNKYYSINFKKYIKNYNYICTELTSLGKGNQAHSFYWAILKAPPNASVTGYRQNQVYKKSGKINKLKQHISSWINGSILTI